MIAMVTEANRIKSKSIKWIEIAKASFAKTKQNKTKQMIDACPQFYFMNYGSKIILCTI